MTNPIGNNPSPINPNKPTETVSSPTSQDRSSTFQNYMQEPGPGKATSSELPSVMDLSKSNLVQGPASNQTLQMQAKNVQDSLGMIEKQLNDPNLKNLKRSQNYLLKQKLQDALDHVHSAGNKMGLQLPEEAQQTTTSALSRFVGMVNHGQKMMEEVQEHLNSIAKTPGKLSPGEMLAIQVKMATAQQELEYTSTLLSKVIQSITQLMNTQL
jgi:hypothetical protein